MLVCVCLRSASIIIASECLYSIYVFCETGICSSRKIIKGSGMVDKSCSLNTALQALSHRWTAVQVSRTPAFPQVRVRGDSRIGPLCSCSYCNAFPHSFRSCLRAFGHSPLWEKDPFISPFKKKKEI